MITAELEIKYSGYFEREREQAEKLRRMGEFQLDAELAVRGDALALVRGATEARARCGPRLWRRPRACRA